MTYTPFFTVVIPTYNWAEMLKEAILSVLGSFPKEHWVHIRTTNAVESPFGIVRLRTDAAKRFKKVQNATAVIWKDLQVAEKSFRTLKGYWLLQDIYGVKEFVDGESVQKKKTGERMATLWLFTHLLTRLQ